MAPKDGDIDKLLVFFAGSPVSRCSEGTSETELCEPRACFGKPAEGKSFTKAGTLMIKRF
jgi:hypothetical protein